MLKTTGITKRGKKTKNPEKLSSFFSVRCTKEKRRQKNVKRTPITLLFPKQKYKMIRIQIKVLQEQE